MTGSPCDDHGVTDDPRPTFADKVRSLSFISGGRPSRPRVTEGRQHPETGRAWKRIEDEHTIVTEHNTAADRVDATAKVSTIHVNGEEMRSRIEQARARREAKDGE